MIGIVLVSHSHKLADGLKDLMLQMSQGKGIVSAAGGMEDGELGTSFAKVLAAIESTYQPDGVLVLIDLGSAELTARLAIEALPPDQRCKVHISPAPLVEGALAAVIAAASGESLESVNRAAVSVLGTPKFTDGTLSEPPGTFPEGSPSKKDRRLALLVTITNPNGLHARPAASFVQMVNTFTSRVIVKKIGGKSCPGNSVFGLVALGTRLGDQITIQATGQDAHQTVAALSKMVGDGFGEKDLPLTDITPDAALPVSSALGLSEPFPGPFRGKTILKGTGISPGFGMGQANILREKDLDVEIRSISNIGEELARFYTAVKEARLQIIEIQKELSKIQPVQVSDILNAHILFLEEENILDSVKGIIEQEKINCEAAFMRVIRSLINSLQESDQLVTRQRVMDVMDIARRVLSLLGGKKLILAGFPEKPAIIILDDLIPSELAEMERKNIFGICVRGGGSTSHGSILARSMEIPSVIGLGEDILGIEQGTFLVMDGSQGTVLVNPDEQTRAEFHQRLMDYEEKKRIARLNSRQPAITLDGLIIQIEANIAGVASAILAVENGADGIGVLRTELMYLDRQDFPSEEEQYLGYTAILDKTGDIPVIFRTLDIGGDKPTTYFNVGKELNPSLGLRSLRYCLRENPQVLKTQIRAILRAGYEKNIKIMFPMITILDELLEAKAVFCNCLHDLNRELIPHNRNVPLGIMIETPAAALSASQLILEADFFSIGSNDLIQYTMASDRTNPKVAYLYQPLHPAVLHLIKTAAFAAHQANKPVALCGDLAADPEALPILLGMGIRELSMAPNPIPETKQIIRKIDCGKVL